jgi:hypothetical protein
MKSDTTLPLSPLGTARQRLAPALAYPAGLLSELRDADLGEEEAFLAWQMGRLAVGMARPSVGIWSASSRDRSSAAVRAAPACG